MLYSHSFLPARNLELISRLSTVFLPIISLGSRFLMQENAGILFAVQAFELVLRFYLITQDPSTATPIEEICGL